MSKGMPGALQKCITYGGGDDLTLSYGLSKSTQISIFFKAEMRCLKKSHGHNLPNFASILNQRGTNPLGSTLIRYGAEILKIVAVSFFCNAAFPCNFFLKFNSTLTAIHEDLNHQNHHVLHIF